jgi:uncharacterized protein with HEPN domain
LPSEKPLLRLYDILENVDRIRRYTEGYTFDRFAEDPSARMRWSAVCCASPKRQESSKALSDVRAVGNVLRHEYDTVDSEGIWQIVEKDLVPLSQAVEKAIGFLRDKDAKPDVK